VCVYGIVFLCDFFVGLVVGFVVFGDAQFWWCCWVGMSVVGLVLVVVGEWWCFSFAVLLSECGCVGCCVVGLVLGVGLVC